MKGPENQPKPVNPIHILYDLQRSEDAQRHLVPEEGLDPQMELLRAWQGDRLQRTYADFLADERYAQACQFFLSDGYAPRDFNQRDHDLEEFYALLSRFVPAPMLSLVTDAVYLNRLTKALDARLLHVLVNDLGMVDELTPALYAQAYRLCDNYAERATQIELITSVLGEVAQGAGLPLVSITLKAARLPAQRLGWSDLHDFLVRGQAAFKRLGKKNELVTAIYQREMRILDRIFAGESEPF